jgi:hypothetical protein
LVRVRCQSDSSFVNGYCVPEPRRGWMCYPQAFCEGVPARVNASARSRYGKRGGGYELRRNKDRVDAQTDCGGRMRKEFYEAYPSVIALVGVWGFMILCFPYFGILFPVGPPKTRGAALDFFRLFAFA